MRILSRTSTLDLGLWPKFTFRTTELPVSTTNKNPPNPKCYRCILLLFYPCIRIIKCGLVALLCYENRRHFLGEKCCLETQNFAMRKKVFAVAKKLLQTQKSFTMAIVAHRTIQSLCICKPLITRTSKGKLNLQVQNKGEWKQL